VQCLCLKKQVDWLCIRHDTLLPAAFSHHSRMRPLN